MNQQLVKKNLKQLPEIVRKKIGNVAREKQGRKPINTEAESQEETLRRLKKKGKKSISPDKLKKT